MSELGEALCRLEDIPDRTGKGFTLERDGRELEIFVVRSGGEAWCYANWCPHYGITLEWMKDKFTDSGGEYIQCSTHGARFRFEDGMCIWGPCHGEPLEPVAIALVAGEIRLADPELHLRKE